ncbi:TPA: DUF58 domain-containing protein [Aeromonas hydrophila]|uniref:DUF58 domain-containing protein n=1 Tax=Aeromonas hydrophila TaxID=644 RepID=UPI001CCAF7E5|nr:DUF58 domain-containing protein [Aeromonas hydrophila]UBQ51592.1 DUF58 domain-containing protein [Aeromonas hydrophila]HDI1212666.1 DUF58 domain-containing protein [Aeromonas hydrophila]
MNWRQRKARWQQGWLARRIPPTRQITLQGRCLFILPTRLGLWYLLVMLAIYLLGTNYQNNLVLLVAYGLGSLFMVTMWLTHRNLLGLSLLGGPAVLGEAGSPLPIPITVRSERPLQALQFSLTEGRLWLAQVDAVPQPLLLQVLGPRRGRLPLERLRVESRYPLGLFRCWTLLDLQLEGWLAPAPEYGPLRGEAAADATGNRGQPTPASMGDFDMLRAHQSGEPLSRVAWKQLAQGRGLLVKQFCEPGQDDTHLSLQRVGGRDLEQRLAVLTWWCDDYAKRGIPFSLTLAGRTLGPDSGAAFLQHCRLALARVDAVESSQEVGLDAAR